MITLYWNPYSPYSRKVRMVLDHKGLPYEAVMDGLFDERGATDALKARSRRAEIPILEDGDLMLWDSTVICEYLDDAYPQSPVHPPDPAVRSQCRLLEDRCDTTLDAAVYAIYAGAVICRDAPQAKALVMAGTTETNVLLEEFDRQLGDREFLCGDVVSVADMALLTHVTGARALGLGLSGVLHLSRWLQQIEQLPFARSDAAASRAAAARVRATPKQLRHQWRSDRIEFCLRHGLADFLLDEIKRGRAYFPPSPSGCETPAQSDREPAYHRSGVGDAIRARKPDEP